MPADGEPRAEAEIVLSEDAASAVYPLYGGGTRFGFEVASTDARLPKLEDLSRLVQERMPWRDRSFERIEWSGNAQFSRALAESFGEGRVWLAGDAAHKTRPLGVQSLNVGLYEARELSEALIACLDRRSSVEALPERYGAARRAEWRRLWAWTDPSSSKSARLPVRRHRDVWCPACPPTRRARRPTRQLRIQSVLLRHGFLSPDALRRTESCY